MRKILIIIIISFFFVNCSKNENKVFLIQPKDIIGVTQSSFYCYGRSWDFQESFKPLIENNILYLHFRGSIRDDYTFCFTLEPFEKHLDPNPITFTGKKNISIELEKKIEKQISFDISMTNDKYYISSQRIDAKNTLKIQMPLPSNGKSINSIVIFFVGEPCIIGIKSIYLE